MMIKRTASKPGTPGGNVDDAALVRLFRQGDTAACRSVETQMRAAVLSAGHLPADDLQDLLQEATVQLWRYVSVDGFVLRGSFRSLAVRIALARRIDRIRRRRFMVELDDDLRDDGRGALELLEEKERLAGLHRALGGIRELCRILVRGRFLENRTYEELGAELERTPETLRVHLHRCLHVLRGMIDIGDHRP